ncbi:MAG: zf-HC2 domain-containing protein [Anaerolineae bacterium]|nr:zf-HC2 domain-containing protein [Anaerolineae bacterium]
MNCEQTRQNLLAFLDDQVSDAERAQIKAHLVVCPDCVTELERLRTLRASLFDAIPAGMAQLRLSQSASDRIRAQLRRERERHSLFGVLFRKRHFRLGWVRAVVPIVVVFFVLFAVLIGPLATPVSAQETVIVTPAAFSPGTDAAVRVIVRDAMTAEPLSDAEVTVRLQPENEQEILLYTGHTGSQGTADVHFRVPDYGSDYLAADLIVNTASRLGQDRVRQAVILERRFRLYLNTDKPIYRPGQRVYMRTLTLESGTILPAAGHEIVLAIHDPDGARLVTKTVRASEYGIAATDYMLPADAVYGEYRLTATLGNTVSERTVSVGQYETPRFRVEVASDQSYYAPGNVVVGTVAARSLDGAPLSGAQVTLRAFLRDASGISRLVATLQGRTDGQGVSSLRFGMPDEPSTEQTVLVLEASVVDDEGHVEWGGQVIPVAIEPLNVNVVAEGGKLRPGVENVLYVLGTMPDGAPASMVVALDIAGQTIHLTTDRYGLGEVRFVPIDRDIPVHIVARDLGGREVSKTVLLSADKGPAQLLVRLDRAAYEVGDAIRVEAFADQEHVIYLDVVREGQTISTHVLELEGGRAEFALDVSPDMVGTLELHAYQVLADGALVRDTRLAVVDSAFPVRVSLAADRATYAPGDVAQVRVDTARDGTPVQSAVGIAVVDESVFALEDRVPGFAKLFFLLEASLLASEAQIQGTSLLALLDPPDVGEVRAAQNVAARAAWVDLPTSEPGVERSTSAPAPANKWVVVLMWGLSAALCLIPLAQWGIVILQCRRIDVTRLLVRRLGIVLVVFFLLAPAAGGAIGGLFALVGVTLAKIALWFLIITWFAIAIAVGIYSWRQQDAGSQHMVLLILAYGTLSALLCNIIGQAGDPGIYWRLGIVAMFLVMLVALLVWCAMLWLEKRLGIAGAVFALVLLSVVIAILLGLVYGADSLLACTIGDPRLYSGPVGWLVACSKTELPTRAPEAIEATQVVKETVVVEKEVEKEVTKVVEKEVQVTASPSPTAVPTATPFPQPTPSRPATRLPATATAQPLPTRQPTVQPTATAAGELLPPPLLGQFRPETIYWMPEILTDDAGRLEIEISLPDFATTWRLTAFASTRQGQLGTAMTTLVVAP